MTVLKDITTTDRHAQVILKGRTVTLTFRYPTAEQAQHAAELFLQAYDQGEPVTITLQRPRS